MRIPEPYDDVHRECGRCEGTGIDPDAFAGFEQPQLDEFLEAECDG